jgi:hypothetical protein
VPKIPVWLDCDPGESPRPSRELRLTASIGHDVSKSGKSLPTLFCSLQSSFINLNFPLEEFSKHSRDPVSFTLCFSSKTVSLSTLLWHTSILSSRSYVKTLFQNLSSPTHSQSHTNPLTGRIRHPPLSLSPLPHPPGSLHRPRQLLPPPHNLQRNLNPHRHWRISHPGLRRRLIRPNPSRRPRRFYPRHLRPRWNLSLTNPSSTSYR